MTEGVLKELKSIQSLKSRRKEIKIVLLSSMIGLLTGITVSFYRILLDDIGRYRKILITDLNLYKIVIGIIIFIIIGITIQKMLERYPLISGSGIPQVNGLLQKKIEFNWLPELIYKFFGGVLAIGVGMSLGREGPSIHLGSLIGDGTGKVTKSPEVEKKYLVTCGASAGISAAFNAPLAGTVFALEELQKFFSPLFLICTLVASGVSNYVMRFMIGEKVTFDVSFVRPDFSQKGNIFFLQSILVIGVFCILIVISAKAFSYYLICFLNKYSELKINKYVKTILFMIIAYLVCIFLSDITGGGHILIERMFFEESTLRWVMVLLVLKFFYTMLCYSTGFPGGIFLPMLVIGALIGKAYGLILFNYFNVPHEFIIHFMLLGMAAYFTAVVRAPITGIVLILEMTGNFSYLIMLIVVSTITYIFTELLKMEPIYEILFERMFLKSDKELTDELGENSNEESKNNYLGKNKVVTLLLHIGADSAFENKKIKNLELPKKMLIVSVRDGEREFIPDGETILRSGNQIVIITDEKRATKYAYFLKEKGMEIL